MNARLLVFLLLSIAILLLIPAQAEASNRDVFELYSEITGFPLLSETNIPEFGTCISFRRSRPIGGSGQARARSETLPLDSCESMELVDYSNNQGERSIDPRHSQYNGSGAVASWNAQQILEEHRRGNRKYNPYEGIGTMQPPMCPIIVSFMPSWRDGGSDFCLCGNRVIETSRNVICDDDQSLTPRSGMGGLWVWREHKNTNHIGISRSDDSILILNSSSTELMNIATNLRTHPKVNTNPRPSQQSFSTWFYLEDPTVNPFNIRIESNYGKYAAQLFYVDVSQEWDFQRKASTMPDGAGIPSSWYSDDNLRSGNSNLQLPPPEELRQGWYFLSMFMLRDGNRGGNIDITVRPVRPGSTANMLLSEAFDIINVYGPVAFDLVKNEDEKNEWACKNHPYLQTDWLGNAIQSHQDCCSAKTFNSVVTTDTGDVRVCSLTDVGKYIWKDRKPVSCTLNGLDGERLPDDDSNYCCTEGSAFDNKPHPTQRYYCQNNKLKPPKGHNWNEYGYSTEEVIIHPYIHANKWLICENPPDLSERSYLYVGRNICYSEPVTGDIQWAECITCTESNSDGCGFNKEYGLYCELDNTWSESPLRFCGEDGAGYLTERCCSFSSNWIDPSGTSACVNGQFIFNQETPIPMETRSRTGVIQE